MCYDQASQWRNGVGFSTSIDSVMEEYELRARRARQNGWVSVENVPGSEGDLRTRPRQRGIENEGGPCRTTWTNKGPGHSSSREQSKTILEPPYYFCSHLGRADRRRVANRPVDCCGPQGPICRKIGSKNEKSMDNRSKAIFW